MFSDMTRELLERSGWYPGRKIDISEMEILVKRNGFPINPFVGSILGEFGGLRVTHPHAVVPGVEDYFHFDVARAISGRDMKWLEDYSKIVGEQLTPVGEAFRDYMILCVGGSGCVYAGFDETLVLVGESPEFAIENLCSGAKLLDLSEPEA